MNLERPESSSYSGLPGAELVAKGLQDLSSENTSAEALLMLVAGPALRRLGIDVPQSLFVPRPFEHRLYELLENSYGADAFSRYNALIRRIVSFTHALERERNRRSRTEPRDGV